MIAPCAGKSQRTGVCCMSLRKFYDFLQTCLVFSFKWKLMKLLLLYYLIRSIIICLFSPINLQHICKIWRACGVQLCRFDAVKKQGYLTPPPPQKVASQGLMRANVRTVFIETFIVGLPDRTDNNVTCYNKRIRTIKEWNSQTDYFTTSPSEHS